MHRVSPLERSLCQEPQERERGRGQSAVAQMMRVFSQRVAAAKSRLGLDTRRGLVKASLGCGVTLTVSGAVQGLYLWSLYRPLPEPRGPLRGVVSYLRDKQQERAKHAAAAAAAPPSEKGGVSEKSSSSSSLVRHVSRGAALAEREIDIVEACPRPRKNILFVGDSLVTGVGCAPDGGNGPAMPRACAAFLAKALRVDVTWAAIGKTGADVSGLNDLLPAVGTEVRAAQERGGTIDMVVVVCGLNDFKHAYTSLRRTASGFKGELSSFVEALHEETGVHCTVVLPALPVHHAPVFSGTWPFRPLITTLASWWDDQKAALAERASALAARRICFVHNATNDAWWARKRYWAADGVHPNDEGYQVWGEHIGKSILTQALLSRPAAVSAAAVLKPAVTAAAAAVAAPAVLASE